MRDNTAFEDRFQRWKNGELVYENGRVIPHYEGGSDGNGIFSSIFNSVDEVFKKMRTSRTWEPELKWDPNKESWAERVARENRKKESIAYYNAVNPTDEVPSGIIDAAKMYVPVFLNRNGITSGRQYRLGNTLGDSVSDAAWRKYLNLPYEKKYLPDNDRKFFELPSVRLPEEIEREIPTDTTMLKNRIEANKKLMEHPDFRTNVFMQAARDADIQALKSLRKTYETGEKVEINENAFNSRQWVKDGLIKPTMPPLNVLKRFKVWYDKDTNEMHYSDLYDFNQYEKYMPGTPFHIKGSIKLPNIND